MLKVPLSVNRVVEAGSPAVLGLFAFVFNTYTPPGNSVGMHIANIFLMAVFVIFVMRQQTHINTSALPQGRRYWLWYVQALASSAIVLMFVVPENSLKAVSEVVLIFSAIYPYWLSGKYPAK